MCLQEEEEEEEETIIRIKTGEEAKGNNKLGWGGRKVTTIL
jgi:hypothetical protein